MHSRLSLGVPMKIATYLPSFSLALVLVALASPHSAYAATFAEGSTDAGQTLDTAKIVNTSPFDTPLNTINGSITAFFHADLFQIYLTGGSFSANTNGTTGTGAMTDTQLFLFNASGIGVFWDDDAGTDLMSQFSLSSVPAGIYYLGISGYDYDPVSVGGKIFSSKSGAPAGRGGALPLAGWVPSSLAANTGNYTISLTGATFVPEPSQTLGLLALAGLGFGTFLRRRRLA
jgi:hypothetical protein